MNISVSIQRKSVASVLRAIDEKRFAVPKLQREFVWDGRKAAKLLDSIVRGMPIGTVMIWQAPRSQRLHLRQKYHVLPQFDPTHSQVWFLMDGQQRISVLHHVRTGSVRTNSAHQEVDFSRVVLDLSGDGDERVVYRKPVDGEFLSLADLMSAGWRSRIAKLPSKRRSRAERTRTTILTYRVYCQFVRAEIQDVREAFLRINTQGMRISTADAIFSRAEDLDLRDVQHEVRDHLGEGFRDISEAPVLFAMLAVRGGKEARGQALERELRRLESQVAREPSQRKSLERTWRGLRTCFGKAVDYLRQNFRVLNRDFLYSDYMAAVLAVFYYWNSGRGPDRFQAQNLKRWFWATSVSSRYSGKNFNRCIRQDLEYFARLAKGTRVRFRHAPDVDRGDLRRAPYQSATGITSAVYCLLLRKKPVGLTDEGLNEISLERYATLANRKDRHHIFPAALMSRLGVASHEFNSITNVCLLTAEENQQIGSRRPRTYLTSARATRATFSAKAKRHVIPEDEESGLWHPNDKRGFRTFIERRTDLLCEELEREAGIRLFRRG